MIYCGKEVYEEWCNLTDRCHRDTENHLDFNGLFDGVYKNEEEYINIMYDIYSASNIIDESEITKENFWNEIKNNLICIHHNNKLYILEKEI